MGTERVIFNMRRLIEERGMKQKSVAERMGLTGGQFSSMLNKRREIKVEDIMKFCEVMGVMPNELFGMSA